MLKREQIIDVFEFDTDGSLIYERVASRAELEARRIEAATPAPPLKRRAYDDINGLDSQYHKC